MCDSLQSINKLYRNQISKTTENFSWLPPKLKIYLTHQALALYNGRGDGQDFALD